MKKHTCNCDCHKREYEFLFICDSASWDSAHYGDVRIHTFTGRTATEALQPYRQAIGNFWSIQGFRRKGSQRWNKCYVESNNNEKTFWPTWK